MEGSPGPNVFDDEEDSGTAASSSPELSSLPFAERRDLLEHGHQDKLTLVAERDHLACSAVLANVVIEDGSGSDFNTASSMCDLVPSSDDDCDVPACACAPADLSSDGEEDRSFCRG